MKIPKGFCQCGCGNPTTIAVRRRWGYIPGQPLPYLPNHSPKDVAARKRVKERRRAEGKVFVLEYLKAHPCVDCGESDPIVLDFDHIDRTSKRKSIADLICDIQANTIVLAEEIAKCVVRCANCHRRKTWKEKEYKKPQIF